MIQEGINYKISTDKPIAYDSPDHLNHFGTKCDNNTNQSYNDKLYELFPGMIRLACLGCAGGASVKSFIDQGHKAVGIEGSNYRKSRGLPEWNNCKDLFTADLTSNLDIWEYDLVNQQWIDAKFDVIQAYEFLEHIHLKKLPMIYNLVKRYLKPNGAWIVSICVFDQDRCDRTKGIEWGPMDEYPNLTNWSGGSHFHHQNMQPKEWWYKNLEENGFKINWDKLAHFESKFVRGPGICAGEDCTINLYIEVIT